MDVKPIAHDDENSDHWNRVGSDLGWKTSKEVKYIGSKGMERQSELGPKSLLIYDDLTLWST